MSPPDPITRLNAALEGRYRIERELGEGGMATVYLADDLRHERKVALKVLKPELAAVVGAERFLAEIKTTANLQHPHILPLFDSGEADSFLFYVMPSVEGESLRDRLDRQHQLPVDDAVRIATNVAEGLDYAHRQGVIHRDIKPANILLQDGKPVISDFGIALAVSVGGGGRLTETGLSLGTPHYMSPEQATGDLNVGPATDIYAVGCVLYEMLVGDPPFTGSTPQAILGKILTQEPPASSDARASIAEHVDACVRRSLEKTPADRFTTAEAFAAALADPTFRHAHEGQEGGGPVSAGHWNPLSVAASLAALVFGVGLLWSVFESEESLGTVRVAMDLGDAMVAPSGGLRLDLSDDGKRFVYVGPGARGGTQLWHRALNDVDPHPIPGTEGASSPSLSPDGLSVAFALDGAIRVVPLLGGRSYTASSRGATPSWGTDGMIYFTRDRAIHRVPEDGAATEPVTALGAGDHQRPDPLPNGRGVLFSVAYGAPDLSRIAVVGPEGGEERELVAGTTARYVHPGHIAYLTHDGVLWLAPFDLTDLRLTGAAVRIAEDIESVSGRSQFAVSRTGSLLYLTDPQEQWELVWVSRSGNAEVIDSDWVGGFSTPTLSPDGTRVAVSVLEPGSETVWVHHFASGVETQVTFSEDGVRDRPAWSPTGDSLLFRSDEELWIKPADGRGDARLLLAYDRGVSAGQFSPDGRWLLFRTSSYGDQEGDILARRLDGDTTTIPLATGPATEWQAAISPDSRWLAYSSDQSGESVVYVIPFPDPTVGQLVTVSRSGGDAPVWSWDGAELFYRNAQDEMVAVEFETDPAFTVVGETVLFAWDEWVGTGLAGRPHYAAASDGRFLMLRTASEYPAQLVLTLNLFDELNERTGN